ncbi:MAG: DUF47 family protein [Candidatus Omnitrophica bacterium]|nr:DUF47 family protein [Candidatus Omnitrophota bacterium]
MQETRNILGWLGREQEKIVFDKVKEQIDRVYETVVGLGKAIAAFVRSDLVAKSENIQKLKISEHEADLLRREIMDTLTEGMITPPDREDLMHFTKSLDAIADYANGAGRLLDFLEVSLAQGISGKLIETAKILSIAMERLKDAAYSLSNNDIKKVLSDCISVEELEEKADEQKRVTIEAIIHSSLPFPILLLVYELTDSMESVADKIEDCADFIRLLAIKSR